jgi:hypothetical protein
MDIENELVHFEFHWTSTSDPMSLYRGWPEGSLSIDPSFMSFSVFSESSSAAGVRICFYAFAFSFQL